ncbi:MAG: hypothetical protein M3Q26_07655 [Acidobacteriota bacterium]|nr:hypothetical protein [Acidobacteriota bacterium]
MAVSPHVNSIVVPLSCVMRRKYNSAWWSVELPDNWEAEQDKDCATFTSERGIGALQISAYRRDDEIVTEEDLLDFAEGELIEGANLNSVSFGEFVGLETSYFAGESFWRKLWLRSGSLLLFVTYTCATEERTLETEGVGRILNSLSLK